MSPINSLVFINQSNDPLIIKATDADSGTNSLLNFYIMEALAKKYFTIDPNTGAVKNSKLIDFELYQQFVFHVKVIFFHQTIFYLQVLKNEKSS